MIRVVLDTNVVISALISPGGLEDRIFKLAINGRVLPYTSVPILAEYDRVLNYPQFGFGKARVNETIRQIQGCFHIIHPAFTLNECKHKDDNRFLECADASGADFLVTGNKRHFPSHWKNGSYGI